VRKPEELKPTARRRRQLIGLANAGFKLFKVSDNFRFAEGAGDRAMALESLICALFLPVILILTWLQHQTRKRIAEINNEINELNDLMSRVLIKALNAGPVEKGTAAELGLASDSTNEKDDAPVSDLVSDLAHVDELCAKLITLAPPREALPLLSSATSKFRQLRGRDDRSTPDDRIHGIPVT